MTGSIVKLPPLDIYEEFEVYINGVPQQPDLDFHVDCHALIFERPLRNDRDLGLAMAARRLGRRPLPPGRHRRRAI